MTKQTTVVIGALRVNEASAWSKIVSVLTLDHKVSVSKPARSGIQLIRVFCYTEPFIISPSLP